MKSTRLYVEASFTYRHLDEHDAELDEVLPITCDGSVTFFPEEEEHSVILAGMSISGLPIDLDKINYQLPEPINQAIEANLIQAFKQAERTSR